MKHDFDASIDRHLAALEAPHGLAPTAEHIRDALEGRPGADDRLSWTHATSEVRRPPRRAQPFTRAAVGSAAPRRLGQRGRHQ